MKSPTFPELVTTLPVWCDANRCHAAGVRMTFRGARLLPDGNYVAVYRCDQCGGENHYDREPASRRMVCVASIPAKRRRCHLKMLLEWFPIAFECVAAILRKH